jgi:hypothetical protein
MRINYATILTRLRRSAFALAMFVVATVAGGFVLQLCEGADWYKHPWTTVAAVIAFAHWLAAMPILHWLGGTVIGFAVGIWVDDVLRRSTAKAPATLSVQPPEKGFLNHQIDALKAGENMTRILDKYTRENLVFTAKVERSTAKMTKHNARNKGTERDLRKSVKLAKEAADDCNKFGDSVVETNRKFTECAALFKGSVRWLYENRPDWRTPQIIAAITSLRDNMVPARTNVELFAAAMRGMHGVTADLNTSTDRMASRLMELGGIISSLEIFCGDIITSSAAPVSIGELPSPQSL